MFFVVLAEDPGEFVLRNASYEGCGLSSGCPLMSADRRIRLLQEGSRDHTVRLDKAVAFQVLDILIQLTNAANNHSIRWKKSNYKLSLVHKEKSRAQNGII